MNKTASTGFRVQKKKRQSQLKSTDFASKGLYRECSKKRLQNQLFQNSVINSQRFLSGSLSCQGYDSPYKHPIDELCAREDMTFDEAHLNQFLYASQYGAFQSDTYENKPQRRISK